MDNRAKTFLIYFTLIIVAVFFFFWGLVKAKAFLAPLAVAALLAMVMLPVSRWLESKGIKRGWAALISDLVILLFFVLLGWVTTLQVQSLSEDWPQLKERIEPKITQLKDIIQEKTGIKVQNNKLLNQVMGMGAAQESGSEQQQENSQAQQQEQSQSSSSGGSILSSAGSFLMQLLNFLGTFLLTFIYIFFFLLYRSKFKKAVLKFVPEGERDGAHEIMTASIEVSKNYLFGRLILIVLLAIFYSIGLSISGVQHAILISILAAVLTLIPYIGNIIGYILAVGMAVFSGSGLTGFIGVTVTFSVAQFVESYILEPYIVGDKVDISPVFTIIVVVLGGAVWGVIGMLIAIPALGIAKVIFDHVPVLKPLGYLFGQEDIGEKEDDSVFSKTKQWSLRKFGKKDKA